MQLIREKNIMDSFDIAQILSFGVIGLGFLLAIMAYNLLSKEQKKESPHESVLKSISKFMVFSLVMAFIGLSSELIRTYLTPNQNKTTNATVSVFTEGDSENGLQENVDKSSLENYPISLEIKITSSKIGSEDNSINFNKAHSLVEVSKSKTEELCIRAKGEGFVIDKRAIFSWKIYDAANNLLKEYGYGIRPTSTTWYVWSCREFFLDYPIGEYRVEVDILGNSKNVRFRLTK